MRGLDHLVLTVRDLDAAEARFRALGFTLTPRAHHPFGTSNNLAIFDGLVELFRASVTRIGLLQKRIVVGRQL